MSIILEQKTCPNCMGNLGKLMSSFVTCPYCGSEFYLPPMPGFRIPEPRDYPHPAGLARISVGNTNYRVHGRLAQGQHTDVFLARRDRALTEMVIIKIARLGEEDGLIREWEALAQVRDAHPYLSHLTCAPIALETARCVGHQERKAAVYRWRSGFIFTLLDARAEYPMGVDPRATIWMWNRILDQLACLHDAGLGHNALLPEHLLLHPRDHGVAMCGWSETRQGPSNDLERSGRCIASLLGKSAPDGLRELTRRAARHTCARALKEELRRVSEAAFGPPKFHTFTLTGGRHGIR